MVAKTSFAEMREKMAKNKKSLDGGSVASNARKYLGMKKLSVVGGHKFHVVIGKMIALPFNPFDPDDENYGPNNLYNVNEAPEAWFKLVLRDIYHEDEKVKSLLDGIYANNAAPYLLRFEKPANTPLTVEKDFESPLNDSEKALIFCVRTTRSKNEQTRRIKVGNRSYPVLDTCVYDGENGIYDKPSKPTLLYYLGAIEEMHAKQRAIIAKEQIESDKNDQKLPEDDKKKMVNSKSWGLRIVGSVKRESYVPMLIFDVQHDKRELASPIQLKQYMDLANVMAYTSDKSYISVFEGKDNEADKYVDFAIFAVNYPVNPTISDETKRNQDTYQNKTVTSVSLSTCFALSEMFPEILSENWFATMLSPTLAEAMAEELGKEVHKIPTFLPEYLIDNIPALRPKEDAWIMSNYTSSRTIAEFNNTHSSAAIATLNELIMSAGITGGDSPVITPRQLVNTVSSVTTEEDDAFFQEVRKLAEADEDALSDDGDIPIINA